MRCTQGRTMCAAILPTTWGSCLTLGRAGIGGPSVGLGGGALGEVVGDEGVQTGSRVVGHFAQADATGTGTAILDLDGADNQHLALLAATTAAGHGIVLTATGDFSLVDLNQAPASAIRPGATMAAAQFAAEQPGTSGRSRSLAGVCSCRAEMPLEWVAIR